MLYLLVIAPSLIEFVMWVLEDAVERGIKRLYFLSRDGYQMYLIAQYLCKKRNLDLDIRYLYVSRFSMRLPGYALDPDNAIDRICTGGVDVTLEKILASAGLSDEEIYEVIYSLGYSVDVDADEILNYRQIQKLKDPLSKNVELQMYMKKHSEEAFNGTLAYLESEGLMENIHYAVVDSGWIGTLQMSIETLLKTRRPDLHLEGYYFGMYSYPDNAIRDCFNPWYFGPEWGRKRKINFCNSLFETIVSHTEGICLGYIQNEDNRYVPHICEDGNANYEHLKNNEQALRSLLSFLPDNFEGFKEEKTIEKLFEQLMVHPSVREVGYYGMDIFSDHVLDKDQQQVAADLTLEEIRNHRLHNKLLIWSGVKTDTLYESAWIEGSLCRAVRREKLSPIKEEKRIRSELKHIRRYKNFLYFRKERAARKYEDLKVRKSKVKKSDAYRETSTASASDEISKKQTGQYFFVIRELTGREIKRKYARSKLGIVWSVLNPLLHMLIMTLIFSTMFKRSIDRFPLYYLTGQLFFDVFRGATTSAMTTLVDNKTLLLRAKLPKQIFVLSRTYTALVNFGYSLAAYIVVLILFRTKPTLLMLFLPLDILLIIIFSMGVGYVLSVIYVFFADIKYLYEGVFLTLLMYMSALFYPLSSLPEFMQTIIGYNPIYLAVYIGRECMVYGNVPHYTAWLKLLIYAAVSFTFGYWLFKRKQDQVMQVI